MNSLSGLLWTVALILIVLWILGIAFSATLGGLVHLLWILILVAVGIEVFRMLTRSSRSR